MAQIERKFIAKSWLDYCELSTRAAAKQIPGAVYSTFDLLVRSGKGPISLIIALANFLSASLGLFIGLDDLYINSAIDGDQYVREHVGKAPPSDGPQRPPPGPDTNSVYETEPDTEDVLEETLDHLSPIYENGDGPENSAAMAAIKVLKERVAQDGRKIKLFLEVFEESRSKIPSNVIAAASQKFYKGEFKDESEFLSKLI